jgi:hypothetical protein
MKNKVNYRSWYILAFLISAILMLLYKYPDELDIIRAFERAERDALNYPSVLTYITEVFHSRIDFIYYGFLYLCVRVGIPLGLATTFVLFLYFVLLIKISTLHVCGKCNNLLLLSVLLAVPTVTVISVSRNAFADVFFLLGIYYYIKGDKWSTIICFLIAVFSHFSVLIYVALFFIAIILSKKEFDNRSRIGLLLSIVVVGFAIPTLMNDVLLRFGVSYLEGTHYESYESLNDSAVLRAPQISNGDKLYFAYTFVMLLYLAIKDKNRDVMYWFMFLLCFLDAFYFNSSVQMSLRLTILTPVCIGYSLISLYEKKILGRQKIELISVGMLLVTLVYYYSLRPVFINL